MARRRAGFWIRLCVVVLYPLDGALFKQRFRGMDNVPKTGGVLLVVNHVSYADPFTFVRFVWECGRIPRTLAKANLFRLPVAGRILTGAKQIPVHRGRSDAGDSLRDAVQALRDGEAVCIYPEGTVTRDPDWWPMQGRTGVARLALETGAPVIPIAQWGAQHAYDRYHKKVSLVPRKQVQYVAGPPVDLSAYRDRPVTRELLREVTDVIMGTIRDQLGEIRGETPPTEFYPQPAPKKET